MGATTDGDLITSPVNPSEDYDNAVLQRGVLCKKHLPPP
jgi:hypothetical protein